MLDFPQLDLECLGALHAHRKAMIPKVFEHRTRRLEQGGCGLHFLEQSLELAFDLIAANRLAVVFTAALAT
ncbi:hypothetical protein ACOTI9_16160 [Achromobacter mucicolens]|uniref:hypothetical protein n=1 Tax=Achromobacter mucicolens TaxID=1389922 RepID=UPI003B9957AF